MKKGFSLVEVMIIFTVLSVILAASIPMVSKKANPIQNKVSHGVYRCIQTNDGLVEELYSGTRQIKSPQKVNKCTFKVPQAAQYKIDMYSAGTGGTKFAMVNTQRDDSRVHTYTMAGGMDNSAVDPILKPNDSELAKMFNGKIAVRSAYTGDAGNGGNADLTYESPYEANCGVESKNVIKEEVTKLKEELEKKKKILDNLKKLTTINVTGYLYNFPANPGPLMTPNFKRFNDTAVSETTISYMYRNDKPLILHAAEHNQDEPECYLDHNGDVSARATTNLRNINYRLNGLVPPAEKIMREDFEIQHGYLFYGSRCVDDHGYITLNKYYWTWPSLIDVTSRINSHHVSNYDERYAIPRLIYIIKGTLIKNGLGTFNPNTLNNQTPIKNISGYEDYLAMSPYDALQKAEFETIKRYYFSIFKNPKEHIQGYIYWASEENGESPGLLTEYMYPWTQKNPNARHQIYTYVQDSIHFALGLWLKDVVDDFLTEYKRALGVNTSELEKEIKELEDRISELENEYNSDSYLKYNKYSKVPFTSIYSDSKLVVNSNVKLQVAEFCNMVFKNYYELASAKRGRTIKAEDTIQFGEKRVANFGGDGGKGVYSRIKIKINYKPSNSGNTTSFADYAKNLLSVNTKGYYPVYCSDAMGRHCSKISTAPGFSNGTDITANYKNRENKSLFEVVTQIALKGYELFSKAVTKLAALDDSIKSDYKNAQDIDTYGQRSIYIHPDDGYTPGTTHDFDPYRPENKTCDGIVFYNYSDYVEYMDAHCTCKSLEYAQTHPFECKNQIDPPINTFVACDGTQFNDQNLLRQYEATVGCNCTNPKYAATHLHECKNQEIPSHLVACDGTKFPLENFVDYMAYVEEHCQEDNPITRTYKACDGTEFRSIMEYEAYTSTVVCNCTNPKYAATHPTECKNPDPTPFSPDDPITSGNKRILKTTDGTSLTYPYIGWHISGVTTPIMPIKTMPTGGERKKIYVDETNEQKQYTPVVNGEVLENMYSVYSNYIFGKNYANSIGETTPKNGTDVVMNPSRTENYKIDTARPSSISVSPANGLDSGSINLSWQEPKLVINSTLWTKRYELGVPGKTGNSISFTATDLGKECTFQVAPRGKVYAKTGDSTKDRATMAELKALLTTSMECKNRDNKVVFKNSVDGNAYTDGTISSPKTFKWSEELETVTKSFKAELAEGAQKHTWKRTSMWAKIFQFMTVNETNEYDLTSKGVGQAGTGTTLIDKCVARRGLYEATTYYMMQYLREDQAETKLPANGIQYTDDTVTGLRRIPRIVSTSDVDKKIATERHSLQEGNQSGFNCYGVEDPSDENVSSATMVITQDSPIVQKGLMDLIIEEGGGGAVVITW